MARPSPAPPKAGADAKLERYRAKRDFTRTAEPSGTARSRKTRAATGRFVVQKHAATRLHYDFRLELDGVLKSWAVTRGPSPDPDDKRLAVRTEDHPLDYAGFEGTIPRGEYGGGTVMLWDRGDWTMVDGKDPQDGLARGALHFTLSGERMKGEWMLIRLKPRAGEKQESWLLRKVGDRHAAGSDDLVASALTSVATGRTMAQIASGDPPVRKAPALTRKAAKPSPPAFRAPALASLADAVPTGDRWLHEIKYDGYRILLAVGGGAARAYTRTGLDWSDRFPGLVAEAAALPCETALLDGEAVVLDEQGRSHFQALQAALRDGGPIQYFAFDLLALDGTDLTPLPLTDRKARLATLIGPGGEWLRYSDHIQGQGETLLARFCAAGLEGVVSKRADARYRSGRSDNWRKIKCTNRQEFIILGWLPSAKASRGFRSLLLGTRKDGQLVYAGKAGTGFDQAEMDRLAALMHPLETADPPVNAPAAATRGAHWIRPELVVEIGFAEVTAEGVLRHPRYLGLRADKPAQSVSMEPAMPISKPAKLSKPTAPAIRISNRSRMLFPEAKLTKGDLADYYAAIAPVMLPWVAGRPVSLVRCPQGPSGKCFFQKHDHGGLKGSVRHIAIADSDGEKDEYLYLDTADGLLTCVQMGTIEFHGWGSHVDTLEQPDRLVFDLDPDEGLGFPNTVSAALHLRDLLADMGLESFAMATGGKGLHVIAPLTPHAHWPMVKDFARRFATALAQSEPRRFTDALPKAQRKGRIFIDYLRNQRGATAIMPYSVRARTGAPVAAPLSWDEVHTLKSGAPFSVGDLETLRKRVVSRALKHWGKADQGLPDV